MSVRMRGDFAWIAYELFPTQHSRVASAVKRTESANAGDPERLMVELLAIFQELIDLEPATRFDENSLRDGGYYGAIIAAGIAAVPDYFATFMAS